MLMRIRNLGRNEDGQAIVLAAVGMLILAVGVLATVNLAHAIHERMRLQNNADATAYSLAALEARAFNFFAFTNRAQVSQYVTAMSFQSWLTVLWFLETLLAYLQMLVSIVWGIACVCTCTCVGAAFCAVVVAICAVAYPILKMLHEAAFKVAEFADKLLGKIVIPGIQKFNRYVTYRAQWLMKWLVATNLGSAALVMPKITTLNDPEVKWSPIAGIASAVVNLYGTDLSGSGKGAYMGVFDSAAEDLGPNSDSCPAKRAQRVMTETSNATRYNDFITNRSFGNVLSKIGGAVGKFIALMVPIQPTGQTKLTTHKDMCFSGCRCKSRFGAQFDHSRLARGQYIVGDEVFALKINILGKKIDLGLGEDYVSVWAHKENGEHCTHSDGYELSLGCIPCPCKWTLYITWPECHGDSENHKWDGIAPYVKFNPDSEQRHLNQPFTYSFLNKTPEALGGQAYVEKFTLEVVPGDPENIDTNVGLHPLVPILPKGLNAWSRAMAYYHRPSYHSGSDAGDGWTGDRSNWREHPNFFNPFWRAKLAPLGDALEEIVQKVGLGGQFGSLLSQELITH